MIVKGMERSVGGVCGPCFCAIAVPWSWHDFVHTTGRFKPNPALPRSAPGRGHPPGREAEGFRLARTNRSRGGAERRQNRQARKTQGLDRPGPLRAHRRGRGAGPPLRGMDYRAVSTVPGCESESRLESRPTFLRGISRDGLFGRRRGL